MTSNFEDLGYWCSLTDLHEQNLDTVITRIEEVITILNTQGFQLRQLIDEDINSVTNPSWIWGVRKRGSINFTRQ